MESIFKKVSVTSAILVFVILVGIFISLFIKAKPAIEEYGLSFFSETSWGKDVTVDKNGKIVNASQLSEDTSTISDDDGLNDDDSIADEDDDGLSDDDSIKDEDDDGLSDDDSVVDEDDNTATTNNNNNGFTTKTIYGGLVPIVGTILTTIIAMLFAVPIAMGISIYLSEIAPEFLKAPVGIAIELLAAIPSIIYGMWGLFYFAPIIQSWFGGYQVSLLTAGLVLGIMILPFMAAITRDAMNTTPSVLKESAYAMGATKFEVIKDVIFPYAKVGILGSIILSLGRALGETMAVAFLIGSVFELPKGLTDPTISIPVAMANNFGEASGMGESALFYLAFILFVMSFGVISFAKFYLLRRKK